MGAITCDLGKKWVIKFKKTFLKKIWEIHKTVNSISYNISVKYQSGVFLLLEKFQ